MRGSVAILLLTLLASPCFPEVANPSTTQATDWLQRYVRIDSTTIEGTLKAAAFLRDLLHREGVATRWIVSPSGLPFLYASTDRTSGSRDALMLMHHLDVVPTGEGWSHPPFGAEVDDDRLYGRGTVDDKSLGIAHLVAFLRSARQTRAAASREVVFLAVSGEEAGGVDGIGWLLANHPELFEDVAAILTEGGNNRVYRDRTAWWGVEVAQKRPLWLLARATGRTGHGSSLNLHSAPHRLIRGLARLVDRPRSYRLSDEARRFLEAVAPLESAAFQGVVENLEQILSEAEPERHLLPGLPNYLLDTVQINGLEAGNRINMIPGEATAMIDVRLLPDTDERLFLAELQKLVGDDVELEVVLESPRVSPSATDHPVYGCLEAELSGEAPVVPAFITAITDARFLRLGGHAVYGFSPFALEASALRGIHGPDEHIPLESFADGVETMWRVVRRCAEN